MTDLLRLRDRVQLAVALGESHFREFKSALEGPPNARVPRDVKDICADIGRTLVAFANADGGELLVGVEDDGETSGIAKESHVEGVLAAPLTHVHNQTPLPAVRSAKVDFSGRLVTPACSSETFRTTLPTMTCPACSNASAQCLLFSFRLRMERGTKVMRS